MSRLSHRSLSQLSGLSFLALTAGLLPVPPPPLSPPALADATAVVPPPFVSDWEAERRRAVVEVIAALEKEAETCQGNRSFLARDLAYEALLVFHPEHPQARKTLGWTWNRKAEEWTRKKYRAPKDKDPELAREAQERREGILAGHRDSILGLLQSAEGIDRRQRMAEILLLLQASPEDPVLRDLNGQVREVDRGGEARWVLKEVVRSPESRHAHEIRLREAVAGAALAEFTAEDWENELGIDWAVRLGTERIRVYGDVERDEVERVAKHVHAVFDVLPPLVGGEVEVPKDYRVYLLPTEEKRDKFLQSYPDVRPDDRTAFTTLASGWLTYARLGCWDPVRPLRVECSVRQTVSFYLWRAHGVTEKQGWIEQGLSLFLSFRIVGTHDSYAIAASEDSKSERPEWAEDIYHPNADFLALARRMLETKTGPMVPFSLGKRVNAMTSEDLLFAFALGAYLVEGYPSETLATILHRAGAGDNPVAVLEETLGHDIPVLEQRLLEWLQAVTK